MSRIPLPLPFGQSLMQGLMQGANMRDQQARLQLAQQAQANQVSQFAQDLAVRKAAQQQQASEFNKSFGIQSQAEADAHAKALLATNPQAYANYMAGRYNALRTALSNAGITNPSVSQATPASAPAAVPPVAPYDNGSMSVAPALAMAGNNASVAPSSPPPQQMAAVASPQTSQQPSVQSPAMAGGMTDNMMQQQMLYNAMGGQGTAPALKVAQAEQIAQNAAQLKTQSAAQVASNAANIKKANAAYQNLRTLLDSDDTLNNFSNIIKTDPGVFSYVEAPFESKFSSDKNVGTVNTMAGPLIAQMVKSISTSHGGIGLANMVAKMKPGLDRSPEVAAGNVEGLKRISDVQKVGNIVDYYQATGSFPNIPGLDPYIEMAKKEIMTGKTAQIPNAPATAGATQPQGAPSFPEGFKRTLGNQSYVWSGGKWRHS